MVPGPRLYPEPMLRRLTLGGGCLLTFVTGGGAVPAAAATESAPPSGLTWGACEEGIDEPFECATLTVPLDYAEPDGATIDLALIRYPAEPAVREGRSCSTRAALAARATTSQRGWPAASTSTWASAAASTSSVSIREGSTGPAPSTASTTMRWKHCCTRTTHRTTPPNSPPVSPGRWHSASPAGRSTATRCASTRPRTPRATWT